MRADSRSVAVVAVVLMVVGACAGTANDARPKGPIGPVTVDVRPAHVAPAPDDAGGEDAATAATLERSPKPNRDGASIENDIAFARAHPDDEEVRGRVLRWARSHAIVPSQSGGCEREVALTRRRAIEVLQEMGELRPGEPCDRAKQVLGPAGRRDPDGTWIWAVHSPCHVNQYVRLRCRAGAVMELEVGAH